VARDSRQAAAAACFAMAAALSPYSVADQPPSPAPWPELRPGLWEFSGRDGGKRIDGKRCANPGEELKVESTALAKIGCKISPVTRSENSYRFQSDCDLKTRHGRELKSTRKSVIKVRDDRAFELRVRGTSNGRPVDDLIVGKRIGDCKTEK
jgi:hypothetical protein